MGLIEDVGPGPVAFDTCLFIYIIEAHPAYGPLIEPLLEAMNQGRLVAVTSSLTLLEVLVVPFRSADDALADRYERHLTGSKGLRLVDIGRGVLRRAARLRAAHTTLRAPDAIQMATAIGEGCPILITNDRQMPQTLGVRILQLKDYLTPSHPPAASPPAART